MISWRSKKRDTIARSSVEAEYREMAIAACRITWLRQLLQQLKFGDTQATTLFIALNPIFYEQTKYTEIDCHFVREKILLGKITTDFVNFKDQFVDMFIKPLKACCVDHIYNKFGKCEIYYYLIFIIRQ